MKLNEDKSNYMVFSRSSTEFATRLTMNGNTLDRVEEVKLLGLWITTYLDWEKNTREICKSTYARMIMLTKLKYVGVPEADMEKPACMHCMQEFLHKNIGNNC